MLQKLYAFLARAPALAGITLAVGDAGPAPGTAGLWCKGVTVLEQRENLLGTVSQRCRAEFTLRLCLPLGLVGCVKAIPLPDLTGEGLYHPHPGGVLP